MRGRDIGIGRSLCWIYTDGLSEQLWFNAHTRFFSLFIDFQMAHINIVVLTFNEPLKNLACAQCPKRRSTTACQSTSARDDTDRRRNHANLKWRILFSTIGLTSECGGLNASLIIPPAASAIVFFMYFFGGSRLGLFHYTETVPSNWQTSDWWLICIHLWKRPESYLRISIFTHINPY